jgi:hypothetical protein
MIKQPSFLFEFSFIEIRKIQDKFYVKWLVLLSIFTVNSFKLICCYFAKKD